MPAIARPQLTHSHYKRSYLMKNAARYMVVMGSVWLVVLSTVASANAKSYLYIPSNGNISVIDTSTNTVVASIPVEGILLGDVVVNSAGTKAYVNNMGASANNWAGSVTAIDTTTNNTSSIPLLTSYPYGPALGPGNIALNSDGTKAYVPIGTGSTTGLPCYVFVIDLSTKSVIDAIQVTDTDSPHGIVVSPDGAKIYVGTYNGVLVIDTSSNTVIDTIMAGQTPSPSAINSSGTKLYITNPSWSYGDTVTIVDTSTKKIVATVKVERCPMTVALNPAGTMAYVASRWGVSVIDTSTNAIVATIPVMGAVSVSVSPDGKRVYIVDDSTLNVSVLDTSTNKIVATIATKPAR